MLTLHHKGYSNNPHHFPSRWCSVRADLPQVAFRKLRQQYVDMGYGLPTETFVPTHTVPANLD